MYKGKRHHFVPRFYLQNFAGGRKYISSYNLPRRKMISEASIAGQCQRHGLYDYHEDAEAAIGRVEARASLVLGDMLRTKQIPEPWSDSHHALAFFLCLQLARTPHVAKRFDDGAAEMSRAVNTSPHVVEYMRSRMGNEFNEVDYMNAVRELEYRYEHPVAETIHALTSHYECILDLKVRLLTNATNIPFLTSDSPVVLHNQLRSGVRVGTVVALSAIGLQIFLPLNPQLCVYLFDSQTYDVESRSSMQVEILRKPDVRNVNLLQFLNAHESVYFQRDSAAIEHVRSLDARFGSSPRFSEKLSKYPTAGPRPTELLMITRFVPNPPCKLSFSTIAPGVRAPDSGNIALIERPWAAARIAERQKEPLFPRGKDVRAV